MNFVINYINTTRNNSIPERCTVPLPLQVNVTVSPVKKFKSNFSCRTPFCLHKLQSRLSWPSVSNMTLIISWSVKLINLSKLLINWFYYKWLLTNHRNAKHSTTVEILISQLKFKGYKSISNYVLQKYILSLYCFPHLFILPN